MTTTYPYLGTPGAMQVLPGPTGTITVTPKRAETIHSLLSGGAAKTQRPTTKRDYSLPYWNRPSIGLDDLLLSFYDGVFDVSGLDLVYVHPVVENVLSLDVSQFGLRTVAPIGWAASSGTLSWDTTATPPPAGLQPTAVVKWNGASASATLQPGTVANTANPATDPVVLADQAVTVSLYVKASAAATLTFGAAGHTVTGADNSSFSSGSIAVTTAWQRFTLTAAVGAFGSSVLVLPRLKMPASSPPTNVWVCAAQLEYGSLLSSFSRGYGSPRVLIASSPGDSRDKWDGYSQHTLALTEV